MNNQNMTKPVTTQSGFTMVELMISLVLGLLIGAAAIQIYVINVRTATVQKSGSELQDASVFGLQTMENNIRLANLDNPTTSITDETPGGGVVMTGINIGVTRLENNKIVDDYADTDSYVTRNVGDQKGSASNAWTGISNTNIESDQLTIQYRNSTGKALADCEGSDVATGEMAIERYFLRKATNDDKKLVLACDAGRLEPDVSGLNPAGLDDSISASDPRAFGQKGAEVIVGVEQFKILLGVEGTQTTATASTPAAITGTSTYVTSDIYKKMKHRPAITSIKLGLIVSGNTPVVGTEVNNSFNLLGETHTLKAGYEQQIRNTYETTVILRNARVVKLTRATGTP